MTYEGNTTVRRQNLKDALVAAAERAIASQGLEGLKARALAAEAGCAVGAIYNAVADLDELVFAVNARTLAALESLLTAAGRPAARSSEDATGQIVRLALVYLEFAAENPLRWRALFDHHPPAGREIPEWYIADQHRLFSYIEESLAALQPAASAEQRGRLARSLFSAVHGMVALGLEEKLQLIPLPVLREQVTLVVHAIGKGLSQSAT